MKHRSKLLMTIASNNRVNTHVVFFFDWKICFNIFKIRTYDENLRNLIKIMKLYKKRPVLTPQFDVNKLQKQLRSVIQTHLDQSANFGPLSTNACDSKPQHKSLKVTRNATNWKQLHKWTIETKFCEYFLQISIYYMQGMLFNEKTCFTVFNKRNYDDMFCNFRNYKETV